MPNVSLQPDPDGPATDALIAGVEDGIYVVGDKSWSIDMQRFNFQFTGQRFYRIRAGRLAGQLRMSPTSPTPGFLGIPGRPGRPGHLPAGRCTELRQRTARASGRGLPRLPQCRVHRREHPQHRSGSGTMKPSEIVESALETLDGGSVILRARPHPEPALGQLRADDERRHVHQHHDGDRDRPVESRSGGHHRGSGVRPGGRHQPGS